MDKFFYNIYKKIVSKKLLSIVILILAVLSLLFTALQIEFEEDITKLIPINDKSSDAQKVLKAVNFADKIIVNIKRQPNGSIDDLTQYATQFIDSVSKNANLYIKHIQGKIEDEDVFNTLDFVYKNLPLFLDEKDYISLQNKITKDSIDVIISANYKTLVSPSGFIAKDQILKDPLGISYIALKKLQQLSFGDDFSLHDGFLLSKDQNHILLFITPTLVSSETSENARFAEILYAINDRLNTEFHNKVQSEYFGGVLVAVANAKQIKQDIQLTVGIAISILFIILIVFYKKITIPIILFIPTIFGGLLAVALLFLIRDKISAISLGIGSILLGVTLDYSLHILTHIRSNNNIKALYKDITKPILMSSLTTALAFLCLLFLDSQALQDLGVFAAISVIGSSVFALLFIPQVYKTSVNLRMKNSVIDKVAKFSIHKKKWPIIILIIAICGSFFTYNSVIFNKDLNKLNFEPQELKDAQERLDVLTNMTSKSVYIVSYGDTEERALQLNDSIYNDLLLLKSEGKIIDFSSIGTLVHSEAKQKHRIEKWNSFWTAEIIDSTKINLIKSGKQFGFKPTSFHSFYALLNSKFKPLNVEDFEALKTISIQDYISSKNNFTTATTLVKVQHENTQNLVNAFKNKPQTLVIDRKQMNETFLGNLKNDFNKLVSYSFIVVLFILLLFYRSFSLTLVTIIPIALTWLLTIGIMGLFHIEFNIFNIIISTFIFGLGIDYSIFITNGLLHEYRTGEKVISTYKTSILLSLITTILGVGVLIFAKHPALFSISLVSIIGIFSAVIISFTLQPLLFTLFIGSQTKRPTELRLLIHSVLSFAYFGIGSFVISIISVVLIKVIPISKKIKMKWFHKIISKLMRSVLYTNIFITKEEINISDEKFEKPAIIIANHSSFLDILSIGMLHPKIIFLVNDWVYNSPIFGKAVRAAGFYPVTSGIDKGLDHLQKKIDQGYSLMAFPEGTRSKTNKIRRFHKGAFYLAEQFNLDIIPVLLHGNSEVNPKGSFIIKDGSVTVKILKRIPYNDLSFGSTYKERTKKISAYFKKEFNILRHNIEHSSYFHPLVLEEFRYKGNDLYKEVKKDLKINQENYKHIIDEVGEKNRIMHFSKDSGQLDFLLALDKPNRNINTYIENENVRTILKNSYITNNFYKILFNNTFEDVIDTDSDAVIINSNLVSENLLINMLSNSVNLLILLKESKKLYTETINQLGYISHFENTNLIILKKESAS